MQRATAALAVAGALVLGGLLGSVITQAAAPKAKARKVVHVVLFKVKQDLPDGAAQRLIDDAHRLLKKIPVVRELHVGYRAPGDRPVHIRDYEVGLYILFDRLEDVQTYLDHPLHVQYARRAGEVVESVRVADFYSD